MGDAERDPRLLAIGRRLRERRRERKLTQDALAERAEISKSHLSEIEGGQTGAGGLIYLRLAEALEVPVQWILTGEGLPPSEDRLTQILPEVSAVADEEGWSHRRAIDVSAALNAVTARRTAGGTRQQSYSRDYIIRVARALEEPEGGPR